MDALARVVTVAARARMRSGFGSYIGAAVHVAIGRNPALLTSLSRLYLDHAATTPVLPEARAAVARALEIWANPNSPHAEGRAARAGLEDARRRIKKALDWDGDLIFTSGASESLAVALGRSDRRVLASSVEHDAVFRAVPNAEILPIETKGKVDQNRLADALRSGPPAIVAVQHANSETGVMQSVSEVASQVRQAGGLLVSDCSQSAGKVPLPDADMIIISAHKLGGPPGIGALLVRDFAMLKPVGGQEFGYRAGTQNVPAAIGFATAIETSNIDVFAGGPPGAMSMAKWLWDLSYAICDLEYPLGQAGGIYQPSFRDLVSAPFFLHSIISLTMPGVSSAAQLVQFDSAGIAVSVGSACSSGSLKSSRILAAFGVPEEEAACTIRVSFGWTTTGEDVQRFLDTWLSIASQAGIKAA